MKTELDIARGLVKILEDDKRKYKIKKHIEYLRRWKGVSERILREEEKIMKKEPDFKGSFYDTMKSKLYDINSALDYYKRRQMK